MISLEHLQNTDVYRPTANCACAACRFAVREHFIKGNRDGLKMIDRRLGETLKAERGKISLRAVSRAAGLSAPFISDCERGRRVPTKPTLGKILLAIKELKAQ